MFVIRLIQVNICQELSFFHPLTHNMTIDCSLKYNKNTSSAQQKQKTNLCTQHVLNLYFYCNSMNNLLSYNWLIDARMRASDKDLPVILQALHWIVSITGA